MPAQHPEREITLRRVRQVIGHLVRDGTAVARVDGSVHTLFPVGIGAAEGEAIRSWVIRERAARTIEVGLGRGEVPLIFTADRSGVADPPAG